MANFDNDDLDEEFEDNELPVEEEQAERPAANRNFLLALGILGGIFLLLVAALAAAYFLRPRGPAGGDDGQAVSIQKTNAAILAANTATAGASTQSAVFVLTPSVTPTATNTPVVAVPSATETLSAGVQGGDGGIATSTPEFADTRTATVAALLTQRAQTQAAGSTPGQATATLAGGSPATATQLPTAGFADDVGLPGLFGMALGLVLVILLARRLRLAPNGQ